ncbi:hypothetical protein ABI_31930 [Asticcacaulis biprosthecium C19]|uniref:Peptidase propeptide and YPEB domain protein n=1 Tax=Asticcacaulis biprosthecium C19 TaxID=715226 RepID=F4QPP1_9CAUL|nr:hypothetical protein [Asticcacaulis biprosthecium]EGF90178.1 hypothetical protein ABI_31930 [Asticcacaulis biprosthecium C19]
MKTMMWCAVAGAAFVLVGCNGEKPAEIASESDVAAMSVTAGDLITEVAAADLPPEVTATVLKAIPGMTIAEAQRKERDGRVYYDVEGKRPDGSDVELDLLQEGDAFKVVEIQRDIAWADAPADVRAVAEASAKTVAPVRVIESKESDGSVIYELFAEGKPVKPSLEVRVKDGKAEVLTEEWPH